MADLGTDLAGVEDIGPALGIASKRRGLLESVMRRWITSPGGLHYAPGYGGGLLDALNGETQSAGAIAAHLESQALEDERVEACTAIVAFVGDGLTVRGSVDDGDGPFEFTFALTTAGVALLSGPA